MTASKLEKHLTFKSTVKKKWYSDANFWMNWFFLTLPELRDILPEREEKEAKQNKG